MEKKDEILKKIKLQEDAEKMLEQTLVLKEKNTKELAQIREQREKMVEKKHKQKKIQKVS